VSPSAVTMSRFMRTAIIITAVLIVIGLTLVAFRRVGPWAPEPWRNLMTGRIAGRRPRVSNLASADDTHRRIGQVGNRQVGTAVP
jgi:hypothetical protein